MSTFDVAVYINLSGEKNLIQKGFLSNWTLFDELVLALNAGSKNCLSYGLHNSGQERNPFPATAKLVFSSHL